MQPAISPVGVEADLGIGRAREAREPTVAAPRIWPHARRHSAHEEERVERDAVLFANEAFYRAFADRDFSAMEQVWSKQEQIACIHPGWTPVIGRELVLASWRAILANPGAPAIACRRPAAFLRGDSAFVICYEEVNGALLVATNLFAREGQAWRMTHHQAGPTAMPVEDEDREETAIH
jgi:hypothetical protein